MCTKGDWMLWINEYGVWPSSEDMNLFLGFRKSLGIKAHLHEIPGHLITSSDEADAASLIGMSLYFCWGALIAPSSSDFLLRISHDEFIELYEYTQFRIANEMDFLPPD